MGDLRTFEAQRVASPIPLFMVRQRYGAAGRALALAEFSIEAMVEGNLQAYRDVCSARGFSA